MRKIKAILRLKYEAKLSHRQIGKSLNISPSTVSRIVNDAKARQFTWPIPQALDDQDLQRAIYGDKTPQVAHQFVMPNWAQVYQALKQHKGVTKQLLWQEYQAQHGHNAYSYSQFCRHFRAWLKQQALSMRQTHQAGDKLFVDYAGLTVPIHCRGEIKAAQLFVATLGASNYTYVEATWSQGLPDWIQSHVNAFQYLGGVTALVVPDNLKSAVTKAHRYDPDINPTYDDLASHYGFAILPARPRRPKDKAKVENAVLVVERWIAAKLRNAQFFFLGELNQAIRRLLDALNNKPFQKLPGTRRSQYEQIDKPALKPLPKTPYQFKVIQQAKVHIDYHVAVNGHYYSAPYTLAHKTVEVHVSRDTVALFYQGKRIATHVRSLQKGWHTTLQTHMPSHHKAYAKYSPGRFLNWAQKIGPCAVHVIEGILQKRQHPEQGYRTCLAVLSLAKLYGEQRLNQACARAIALKVPYHRHIESILKHGMDTLPSMDSKEAPPLHHDNIRGEQYYQCTGD